MRDFILPAGLVRLLAAGVWPSADGPKMTEQEFNPIVSPERVRLLVPGEDRICLERPLFVTVAQMRDGGGAGDFWEKCGALHQIEPEKALVIGDFGMGSDSPIVLDYGKDFANPPVMRLRLGQEGYGSQWIFVAWDFDAFAKALGLEKGEEGGK